MRDLVFAVIGLWIILCLVSAAIHGAVFLWHLRPIKASQKAYPAKPDSV